MQNLNDFNNMRPISRVQTSNQGGANNLASSGFSKFVNFIWAIVPIFVVVYAICAIVSEDIRTRKQIQANFNAFLNSPRMQEYRTQEARWQREIEKQKRLKELGIESSSTPTQKNDLLNEQLRKQEIAEQQKPNQASNVMDYRQKLEIYRQAQAGKIQGK